MWCTYCKGKGHAKETCWKFHGRPPQVHMMTHPYLAQGKMQGGQQWMQNCIPPPYSNGGQPSTNINSHAQLNSHHLQEIQKIREEMQQMKNLLQQMQNLLSSTSSGSAMGSTSLANSGKTPILSALSSLSVSNSYQNSWILEPLIA